MISTLFSGPDRGDERDLCCWSRFSILSDSSITSIEPESSIKDCQKTNSIFFDEVLWRQYFTYVIIRFCGAQISLNFRHFMHQLQIHTPTQIRYRRHVFPRIIGYCLEIAMTLLPGFCRVHWKTQALQKRESCSRYSYPIINSKNISRICNAGN
jgi:hypothetical protein